MKGHSGATLSRVGDMVKKTAPPGSASERLVIQAELQSSFKTDVPFLRSVPILDVEDDGEQTTIWMPYIDGHHPLKSGGGMIALDRSLAFIRECMKDSVELSFPGGGVFYRKVQAVADDISANPIVPTGWERTVAKLSHIFSNDVLIPTGRCHGDLTFGNMLQDGLTIFVFDFLDTIVPSPLFDMCKLRQDTSHGWAQVNGLIIGSEDMATLDLIADRVLSQFPAYRIWYPTFQLLNLLRILPYCKERRIAEHVLRELETIS